MDNNSKQLIEKTRKHVKTASKEEYSGHDYWHIYRVWKMAQTIAKEENANQLTVQLTALLHDLGDPKITSYKTASNPARNWLTTLTKDKELINEVCHIIDNMSFRHENKSKSLSLEGKVVQDADRLDAIGAIGISRALVFSGYKNNLVHNPSIQPNLDMSSQEQKRSESTAINHFYEKLLLLKDKMNTSSARKIAQGRHEFMEEFLDRFYKEWEGEI